MFTPKYVRSVHLGPAAEAACPIKRRRRVLMSREAPLFAAHASVSVSLKRQKQGNGGPWLTILEPQLSRPT